MSCSYHYPTLILYHIKEVDTINNHVLCKKRDKALIKLLETQGALNTDQIRLLLFKDTCLRIVQRRLKRLSDTGRIKRGRQSIDEPYYYYASKKPGQLEHVLGVSWIYAWVCSSLSSSMKLHSFEREVVHKTLRPDALICVKRLWSSSLSLFYGEFDVSESGHDFAEKVRRYNDFYKNGDYLSQWWVPLAKRFPIIRVVTTGNTKSLEKKIASANENNLEFQVFSLNQVKGECLHGSSCSSGLRP